MYMDEKYMDNIFYDIFSDMYGVAYRTKINYQIHYVHIDSTLFFFSLEKIFNLVLFHFFFGSIF